MEGLPNNKIRVTDAIVLAALPAYVYLVTFVYEYAYCSHFNIPKSLITPSLTTILVFASAIGALLLSSFKVLSFTTPLFRVLTDKNKTSYHGLVGVNALFLLILILILYIYPFTWTLLLTPLISFLVIDILYFGIPVLIAIKKKKTVEQGLEAVGQDEDKFDFLVFIMRNLSRREKGITLLLIGIVALSYMIGDGEALKQSMFPTLAARPNTAVIRIYGDLLICAQYTPETKMVSDSLILIHTTKSSETVLVTKDIGPLLKKQNLKESVHVSSSDSASVQADTSAMIKDPTKSKREP